MASLILNSTSIRSLRKPRGKHRTDSFATAFKPTADVDHLISNLTALTEPSAVPPQNRLRQQLLLHSVNYIAAPAAVSLQGVSCSVVQGWEFSF